MYGPVRTVVWEGRSREAPPYPDCATALRVTAPAKKLGARAAQRLDALRAAIVRADEARAQGLQGGLQAKIADMDTQQSTSVHWAARRAEKGTSSFVLRAAPTRLQQPR